MRIYVALPPGGILKVPLVDAALDEVIPEYELTGIADADEEMLIIEFCEQYKELVSRAIRMVYGEPLSVHNLNPPEMN